MKRNGMKQRASVGAQKTIGFEGHAFYDARTFSAGSSCQGLRFEFEPAFAPISVFGEAIDVHVLLRSVFSAKLLTCTRYSKN